MRAMKDSGIEWIGQVPESWESRSLKYALDAHSGGAWGSNEGGDETDVICVRVADFDYAKLSVDFHDKMTVRSYTEKAIAESSLKHGDILLEKSGGGEVTPVGRSVLFAGEEGMMCANFIEWLRPNQYFNSCFLSYWLAAAYINGFSKRNVKQTTGIQNLDIPAFLSEKIVAPNVIEQKQIAQYLDVKCAEIDALIGAREKTNALLKERRQSIIYEAVTKGLNPDAPMKDSGIEWIGQIPENWEVIPLSKVSERMNNGYVGPTRNIFFDSGVRYLQSLHIKEGKIIFEKAPYYVSPEWAAEHALGTVHTGDVLIVQTGDIGQVACVPEEYHECNCHALIIVTPRSNFCYGEYLSYLLQSHYGRNQLLSCRTGALHPHLNSGNIGSIKLPIPPVGEQQAIVTQLNQECEEYDNAIRQNNATIEKLKEYRQSIIYEAVTGKIEV